MKLKSLLISICLVFIYSVSYSQPFNSARLSLIQSQQVEVYVNSFDEIENGITVPGGTVLGVTLQDLNDPSAPASLSGFEIFVRTNNGISSNFEGINGNSMDLDILSLTSSNRQGFGSSTFFYGPLSLDQISQLIAESTLTNCDWSTHQINVQYEFGTANCTSKFTSFKSDFYTVEVEFILEPVF
jgi:hypothetical protein